MRLALLLVVMVVSALIVCHVGPLTAYTVTGNATLTISVKAKSIVNNRYFRPGHYPPNVQVVVKRVGSSGAMVVDVPATLNLEPGTYNLTAPSLVVDDYNVNFTFYRWGVLKEGRIYYYYARSILLSFSSDESVLACIEYKGDKALWSLSVGFVLSDGSGFSPPKGSVRLTRRGVEYGSNTISAQTVSMWEILLSQSSNATTNTYYLWEDTYVVEAPKYVLLPDGYVAAFVRWSDGVRRRSRSVSLVQDKYLTAIYDKVPVISTCPSTSYAEVALNISLEVRFYVTTSLFNDTASLVVKVLRNGRVVDPRSYGLSITPTSFTLRMGPGEVRELTVNVSALKNAKTGLYTIILDLESPDVTHRCAPLTLNVTPPYWILVEAITVKSAKGIPVTSLLPLELGGVDVKVKLCSSYFDTSRVEVNATVVSVGGPPIRCVNPLNVSAVTDANGRAIVHFTVLASNATGSTTITLNLTTTGYNRLIEVPVHVDSFKPVVKVVYVEAGPTLVLKAVYSSSGEPVEGRGDLLEFTISYMVNPIPVDDEGLAVVVLSHDVLERALRDGGALTITLSYRSTPIPGLLQRLTIKVERLVTTIHEVVDAGDYVVYTGQVTLTNSTGIPGVLVCAISDGHVLANTTTDNYGLFSLSVPKMRIGRTLRLVLIPSASSDSLLLADDCANVLLVVRA